MGRGLAQEEAGAAALEVVEAIGQVNGVFAQDSEAVAEPGPAHVEGVAEIGDGGGLGAKTRGDRGGEALEELRRARRQREQAQRAARDRLRADRGRGGEDGVGVRAAKAEAAHPGEAPLGEGPGVVGDL